jgi:hypothetical protein
MSGPFSPQSLPPGPPYGDGTPYGYGDPYGYGYGYGYGCAYAGAGYSYGDSSVPGYGGDYGYGSDYGLGGGFGLITSATKPIRTNPNVQYIAAMPGLAYTPEQAIVLSDEWERQLGVSGRLIYRRMMLDPQVRSSFSYFVFAVLGDGPSITPAITRPPDRQDLTEEEEADFTLADEIAEFVRRQQKRIDRPIEEVAGQLLYAAAYKAMLAEIVQEYCEVGLDAGRQCLKSLPIRSPRSWSFITNVISGETIGYFAWTAEGPQVIAAEHCEVLAWEPEAGDPRGTSLFEAAYSAWNEKVSLVPERFKHLALFGSPSVHYELPENAQPYDQLNSDGTPNYSLPQISPVQQGMIQLSGFRAGGMIVTYNGGKINLISGALDGGAFTAAKVDCNREIATAILMTTGATMEAKHDSNANAETKQDATGFLIGRGKTRLAAVFRAIYKRLVVANWGQEVADRLTPLVSFSAEHHDRNAIIEANVKAGWKADPTAYPVMDVQAGFPVRPAVDPNDEEEVVNDEIDDEQADESAAKFASVEGSHKALKGGGKGGKPSGQWVTHEGRHLFIGGGKDSGGRPSSGGTRGKASSGQLSSRVQPSRTGGSHVEAGVHVGASARKSATGNRPESVPNVKLAAKSRAATSKPQEKAKAAEKPAPKGTTTEKLAPTEKHASERANKAYQETVDLHVNSSDHSITFKHIDDHAARLTALPKADLEHVAHGFGVPKGKTKGETAGAIHEKMREKKSITDRGRAFEQTGSVAPSSPADIAKGNQIIRDRYSADLKPIPVKAKAERAPKGEAKPKAEAKPKRELKAKPEASPAVDTAHAGIQKLYKQAGDDKGTFQGIDEHVQGLSKLSKGDLNHVADRFGLGGNHASKKAAIEAIGTKIKNLKKSVQRTQF